MTTVAVMQPYFIPYAGYFRLFQAADVVVMFDCVQFPRRGWVHRNRLPVSDGTTDWFTLPVARAPRDALISELVFAVDARERMETLIARFPLLARARKEHHPILERVLDLGTEEVAGYISELVRDVSRMLGFDRTIVRSSTLHISPQLRAQDRIIAIAQQLGATRYVNASGGRELYDRPTFAAAGIDLAFLAPYAGRMDSILTRLLTEPAPVLAAEIARETVLVG